MTTTPTLRDAAQAVLTRWESPLWRQEVGTNELMKDLRAALAAPADALAEPVATITKEALIEIARQAGFFHYDLRDVDGENLGMQFESGDKVIHDSTQMLADLLSAQLQQAVARAVEKCAVICEGMHEEDRPGDYAAAIRQQGTP